MTSTASINVESVYSDFDYNNIVFKSGDSALKGRICKNSDVAVISNLFVDFESRRKGVGSCLFYQFQQLAKSQNKKLIAIDVFSENHIAISFWEKLGFTFSSCGIDGFDEYFKDLSEH